MEKNAFSAAEDSIDSIPGPAFEPISTTPTKPLKSATKISDNVVVVNNEPESIDGVVAEMEGSEECSDIDGAEDELDVDDDQDDDAEEDEQAQADGDDGSFIMEDDCSERNDVKKNEQCSINQESLSYVLQAEPSVDTVPSSIAALEQVSCDATTTNAGTTKTSVSSTIKTTLENASENSKKPILISEEPPTPSVDSVCHIPVQIVSAVHVKPKMLPVKTKNNKLIMVQMTNENQHHQLPVVNNQTTKNLNSSTVERNLNDSTKVAVNQVVVSDTEKELITKEEKTQNSAQQEDQQQEQSQPQQQQQQAQSQQNSRLFAARSSTPLSREFLALQRSVNESKVLSEFVTDTVRKRQKGTPKDANEQSPSHHQQQQQQQTHQQQPSFHHHHHHHHHNSHSEKQRKSSKFAPLKGDGGGSSSTASSIARRSRSKSVNRKSIDTLESTPSTCGKLKRWPSDEKMSKRTNMRSQNSEFVQKQIEFLNRVKHDEGDVSSEADDGERSYLNGGEDDESTLAGEHNLLNESNASATAGLMAGGCGSTSSLLDAPLERETVGSNNGGIPLNMDSVEARLMAYWAPPPKHGWDSFCWKCRECADLFACSKCLRSFHCTCIKITASTKLDDTWICPECVNVDNVLNGHRRSRRGEMSLDLLSQLLSFALKRMKMVKGYSMFLYTEEDLMHYSKYIVNPVTFTTLQDKIEKRVFRCPEEFLNETKWILHNALILSSGTSSKEVFTAKAILKVCRQETNEIDTCGECYLNANTRTDWFVDVCSQPHLLLWAKLKGFPYWPAKAMGPGQGLSHVNVRFFGEHDRAFVPVKDCFLYSEQDPNTQTGKRSARELADCIKEVELHIAKIKSKVGTFKYAKLKTPYEPAEELQQLEMMMPGVTEYMKKQQALLPKPPLQYKIVKTADNHLSIIKKASTTESSGNDSDNSGSPSKKSGGGGGTCANSVSGSVNEIKPSLIASKYEVVNKVSSDESNTSKVTAVILKRKSSSERKKEAGGEDLELPLPKMIKFDEEEGATRKKVNVNNASGSANTIATGKRKLGTDTGSPNTSIGSVGSGCSATTKNADTERHRSKHAKHEKHETPPRVPLIKLKTKANELVSDVESKGTAPPAATSDSNNSTVSSAKLDATTREGKTPTMITATNVAKEEFISATVQTSPATPQTKNAQAMMQILVKNKHGVTIKKISKDGGKKSHGEPAKPMISAMATANTNNAQAQLPAEENNPGVDPANGKQQQNNNNNTSSGNKQKANSSATSCPLKKENDSATAGKSAATTHILKDLVPFVEIKKEVASDDETDIQMPAKSGKQTRTSADIKIKATTAAPPATVAVPAPKPAMPAPLLPNPASSTLQPNLSLVKKEVMSDEEELATNAAVGATGSSSASTTQMSLSVSAQPGDKACETQTTNAAIPPTLTDAVRVGDTMIQRVNVKNTRSMQPTLIALKSQAQVAQEAAAAMDAATAAVAAAMNTSPPVRRPIARGVPYGPLPASAVAHTPAQKSTVTFNNTTNRTLVQQQQPQQQQTAPPQVIAQPVHAPLTSSLQVSQQRARKSFTNRVTPDISPASKIISVAAQPSPTGLPTPSTSPCMPNNDMKRTLLKNSMVSIPRQAWSPHESSQRNANVSSNSNNTASHSTHSIPVPPLTAVSKMPTVVASLSGDNNITGNSTTNHNANLSCNSSTSFGNVTINSTPIATPIVSCNGTLGSNGPTLLTPLTMSAPPPLAGLSQPSINILAPTSVVSMAAGLPILGTNSNISSSSSNISGSISISSAIELSAQTVIASTSSISGMASTSYTDFVTPTMAAMVTDAICRGPPKMIKRPNGPLQSEGATMFPSQAGPVCQTLVDNAHKLTDFFISVMEDTMVEMSVGEEPVLQAKITLLKMELERTKQTYEQEISELKRTSDLMICEMRKSMENEKTRIANEIRKQCEQERLRSIEETKKKQWCSNCGREAQFYCCWNTSYCDYPCQQMHWSRHSGTCAQTRPTTVSAADSLAKPPASTMTTTVSTLGHQQQQVQQQTIAVGKVSSSGILTVTPSTTSMAMAHQQTITHYNKSAMINNKKDKHTSSKIVHQLSIANSIAASNTLATIATSNASGVSVAASAANELLKLPSNTYLRTVPQCGNNNNNNSSAGGANIRGSTYAVQRVNIPLPITALVQRGSSWELTSAAPNNNTGITNMATLTAPGSNVSPALSQLTSQQQHQQRMISGSGGTSNMSMSRGNSRNRSAAMQQTMHGTATSGGSSTAATSCGVIRPTKM
ncbi:MYND-type zinc finger-containing chromatin reader Zmynd8 [Eurosta solidaginis]|uniref:MYND-type zinc finger-containing chromatin reader Zmynd8 n=1 Tax=Eurosta solidaginis TaxID=178769 RepID=UPI0035305D47